MTTVLYIQCNILSIAIVLLMLFSSRKWKTADAERRIFNVLLISTAAVLTVDSATWLLEGASFPGAYTLYSAVVNIHFLLQLLPCFLWLRYCDRALNMGRESITKNILFALPELCGIALFVVNLFTGIVCSVDENMYYRRGPGFYALALIAFFYLASSFVLAIMAIRRDKGKPHGQYAYFVLFPLFPAVGVVLQALLYGLQSPWTLVTYALLLVYVNVQSRREQLMEQELTKSRVAIMLSQIQPHFLYNALGAIQELCRRDPKAAESAVMNFSRFLRVNIDSLTADRPIAFESELGHTQNYLAIEKLRFGDCLKIEYDIRATLFRIPTLTLQPIVENAVRYGVMKREEGGTVKISSEETDEAFVVTVTDDGVGFDPRVKHDDGRTHIGIENVRERLERMSGGTLNIKSVPGEGTEAVITIPKEE